MNEAQVKEIIFRALKQIAPEISPEEIQGDANLRDQIDLDSMDFLNFVIKLHETLKVDIPEQDYAQLATLNSCVHFLMSKVSAK